MGEQRQQGNLPDVGAFAGHVRAGDHGDLTGFAVELRVVWHERFADHGLLEHRVAALVDLQDALVPDVGANVCVKPCHLGKPGQHVELCQRGGDLLHLWQRL